MTRLNKASLAVFAITILWVFLMFISPLLIEPGTVRGLDGGANVVDYPELWRDMPPVISQVYWFGDFNCHQKESRSIILNGNQMPVCARDVGIFMGMALGALAMVRVIATQDIFDTGLRALPKKLYSFLDGWLTSGKKKAVALAMVILGLLPMAVDGFTQLLTGYESTNAMRLATGFLAGIIFGAGVCVLIESMLAPYDPPYAPAIMEVESFGEKG